MENLLNELSRFSLLFALVAAIVAGILANILASLMEKVAGEHPRFKALSPKKQLCLVSILFVIFSIPSIYQQYSVNANETETIVPNKTEEKSTFVVEENSTINLFEGDLSITLVKFYCSFANDKEMIIGSPGFENLKLETESVVPGNSVIFEGRKPYEIRIVKLDNACSWVEVQVVELSEFPKIPKYELEELQTETITIETEKTGFSSDGKLSISVSFVSSSFINAVVGSFGFPNKNIIQQPIGYALEYEAGEYIYNIRIIEIESYKSVKLQITTFQKRVIDNP